MPASSALPLRLCTLRVSFALNHCASPSLFATIAEAVISIKLKDIELWIGKEIKESIQSQRSKIRNFISELKEKMGEKNSGIFQEKAVGF